MKNKKMISIYQSHIIFT